MIDLDRMTNDPTYQHYAYRPRPASRAIFIPWWVIIGTVLLLAICAR